MKGLSILKLRRAVIAAVTATTVVSSTLNVPAYAYTVSYDEGAQKCTISFTEQDQTRINDAYKNVYGKLADQLVKTLGEKESTKAYSQEQRKQDLDVYVAWAKTVDDPNPYSSDPKVKEAQQRLWRHERQNYNVFVALSKASKKDLITDPHMELTREEAKKLGETLGLDLTTVLGGGFGGILGSVLGGVSDIIHSVKVMMREDALQFAAPIGAYNKALTSCAEGVSDSSSVPAGSSLSFSGLVGVLIAGIVGLVLVAAGIGFAVRPAVDGFFGPR